MKLAGKPSPQSNLIKAMVLVFAVTLGSQILMAQASVAEFDLAPNPKVVKCLGVPAVSTPRAHVKVVRGFLSDSLTITADSIRPGLAFDMFTVQRSNLKPAAPSIPRSRTSEWPGIRAI